jgi:hypothetical protein
MYYVVVIYLIFQMHIDPIDMKFITSCDYWQVMIEICTSFQYDFEYLNDGT